MYCVSNALRTSVVDLLRRQESICGVWLPTKQPRLRAMTLEVLAGCCEWVHGDSILPDIKMARWNRSKNILKIPLFVLRNFQEYITQEKLMSLFYHLQYNQRSLLIILVNFGPFSHLFHITVTNMSETNMYILTWQLLLICAGIFCYTPACLPRTARSGCQANL